MSEKHVRLMKLVSMGCRSNEVIAEDARVTFRGRVYQLGYGPDERELLPQLEALFGKASAPANFMTPATYPAPARCSLGYQPAERILTPQLKSKFEYHSGPGHVLVDVTQAGSAMETWQCSCGVRFFGARIPGPMI